MKWNKYSNPIDLNQRLKCRAVINETIFLTYYYILEPLNPWTLESCQTLPGFPCGVLFRMSNFMNGFQNIFDINEITQLTCKSICFLGIGSDGFLYPLSQGCCDVVDGVELMWCCSLHLAMMTRSYFKNWKWAVSLIMNISTGSSSLILNHFYDIWEIKISNFVL